MHWLASFRLKNFTLKILRRSASIRDMNLSSMVPSTFGLCFCFLLAAATRAVAEPPKLPGVGAAMQEMIAKNEIAGAVTVVVSKDKVLHLETSGFVDIATKKPMRPDK